MSADIKPTWIIESGIFDEDGVCDRIKSVLDSRGCPSRLIKYCSFGGSLHEDIDGLDDACVVGLTSLNACKTISRAKKRWYPGFWCDWNNLSCRMYYSYWHEWLLNKDAIFLPYRVIIERKDELYDQFGGDVLFIRPDSNDKLFSGEPVSRQNFNSFVVMMEQYLAEQESPMCVVGPCKTITNEYRLLMSDGKYITGSKYRDEKGLYSSTHIPDAAVELAERAAQKWSPHPIFVLDIADTPCGCAILECGSVNCAGIYDADLEKWVDEVNRQAVLDWKEYFTDEV